MNTPNLFSYLSPEDAAVICKLAEAPPAPATPATPAGPPHAGKTIGALLTEPLGMALGTVAGAGSAYLAHKVMKASGHHLSPYLAAAAPVIGGGLGLAYSMAKAHQMEALRDASKNPEHKPKQ